MTGLPSIVLEAPSSEQDGGQGSPFLLTLEEGARVLVGFGLGFVSGLRFADVRVGERSAV